MFPSAFKLSHKDKQYVKIRELLLVLINLELGNIFLHFSLDSRDLLRLLVAIRKN